MSLTIAFLVLAALTTSYHEMWRDEAEPWLIARASGSLTELFQNVKYEGHPALWYVLLWLLSRLVDSPVVMHVLHLALAAGTVYLIARASPFTLTQRTLLPFGYFFFYEYAVVARHYALGILLFFLFCALYSRRYQRAWPIGLVLFLLPQIGVHFAILSIAILCALLVDHVVGRSGEASRQRGRALLLISGLAFIGIVSAIVQMIPPHDSGYAMAWRTGYEPVLLKNVLTVAPKVFLPVPALSVHFHGSWIFAGMIGHTTQAILQLGLLVCVGAILLHRPAALVLFTMTATGLITFLYVKYLGAIRHWGLLFIVLLGVAWIHRDCQRLEWLPQIARWIARGERILRGGGLTALLLMQTMGGVTMAALEQRYVFSNGKAVATFIAQRGLTDMAILAEPDYVAQSIFAYLGKDRVYFVRGQRFGSFVRWDTARRVTVTDEEVLLAAAKLAEEQRTDVLIIMNRALDQRVQAGSDTPVVPIGRFEGAAVWDENFYLYIARMK